MMPGFFPPDYQTFAYRVGDVLADLADGQYALTRVLSVDKIDMVQGQAIAIADRTLIVASDDYLLVVGCALGEPEFASIEAATAAVLSETWLPYIGHAPMRANFIGAGSVMIGNFPVREAELEGVRVWREAFARGEAGIF